MRVVESLTEWKRERMAMRGTVGLVPTMGFLHAGHLSLVERARRENDHVVAWIFVNPKQFGPKEDFQGYPRDMNRDLALLESAKVDYVLAPTVEGVYPPGFQTTVTVQELSQPLEGAARPGHFTGVATVVCKMFCLAQPHRAYFGQKDAQQCLVVTRMAQDLGFLLEVVVCPTVREPDGLAMSSRNVYLTPEQRAAAPVLYQALQAAQQAVERGERQGDALRALMRARLAREPLAQVEYVSVADAATLQECQALRFPAVLSLAARMGKARLIDNIPLPAPPT